MTAARLRLSIQVSIAVVALVAGAGCGGDDDATPATDSGTTLAAGTTVPTSEPTGPTGPTTPGGDTTSTTTATPDTATTPPTFEIVTTSVVGAAVGGSAGATGSENTDPFSEAVRNEDGTCSGWDGPGGTWTQGLESGAPVVFIARDSDAKIGTGAIGTSRSEDVGTDREQWNCIFPFEGEIEGEPESFRIKVADLPPWVVVRNPSDASQWIVSIDTRVRVDVFDECVDPGASVEAVSAWNSVGTFWSRGIPQQLCGSGLAVVDVERPCRPQGIASEHIVKVTRADDPSVVLEDASGLLVDPAELTPGTEVVVHVATGRPCG
jgi:hypothetical protein